MEPSGSSIDEKGQTAAEDVIAAADSSEYPEGFKLAMIVVALVLSLFLISIDLVSNSSIGLSLPTGCANSSALDDCLNSHS